MAATNVTPKICSIEGCTKGGRIKRGMCEMHYVRDRRGVDMRQPEQVKYSGDDDARFEQYIEHIPFSECALWSGFRNTAGYGGFGVGGRMVKAHRYQWMRHNGPIPDGLHVLHTCHNGHLGCVSLDHLKLGRNSDNVRDRVEAGRSASKLDEASVRVIRKLSAIGVQRKTVAALFGVASCNITSIVSRRTWKHVD